MDLSAFSIQRNTNTRKQLIPDAFFLMSGRSRACSCTSTTTQQLPETRPRSKSDDEWLLKSPGLTVAYELLGAGKISQVEMQQIVAQDRLWHTGERTSCDSPHRSQNDLDSSLDEYDVEAQLTDADLGLGLIFYDPLSLEQLGWKDTPIFIFRGKQEYNIDTLYNFIMTTHTYLDPTTRLEYTDDELDAISRLYSLTHDVDFVDFVKLRKHGSEEIKEEQLRRSALDGVENILDGVMSDIRDCIEGHVMEHCIAERFARSIHLMSSLLPYFDFTFQQLKRLSSETTRNVLKIYLTQLHGHPQRRTKDPYNLLKPVLRHIKECLDAMPVPAEEQEQQKWEEVEGEEEDIEDDQVL